MPYSDPPEPPEGGSSMRATELVNKICLFRPDSLGEWPAKEAELDDEGNVKKKARGPQTYVECSVWVLDRAGIVEEGENVRVSWWKAVEQLKDQLGYYVGGKPTQEPGSNAIYLVALEGDARAVAERIVKELEGGDPDGTEPF